MTDDTEHNDPFDAAYANLPEDASGEDIIAFLCAVIASYATEPEAAMGFIYDTTKNLRNYYVGKAMEAVDGEGDGDTCTCPSCTARREAEVTKH